MPDDPTTPAEPETPPEPDEDEEAWNRLSPRLRALMREELEEHSLRQTPPAPEPTKKTEPEPAPTPAAAPKENHERPRRTAADVWFGRRPA